jgi:hypothetical protein
MLSARVHHAIFRRVPQDHRKSEVNGLAKIHYYCKFGRKFRHLADGGVGNLPLSHFGHHIFTMQNWGKER